MQQNTLLVLEQVSKSFPGVKALKKINLSIERGEIHALLGENGAGKSTLIKILGGIQPQDEGTITLNGVSKRFGSYNDSVEAGIGIVFQEFSLIPYLNATENIFLGREKTNRFGLLRKQEMRAKASQLFARLGVELDLDCAVARLSVAEQQFVEIAKALALDVNLLILDEPTATLTPAESELLFEIMRELKSQGVTIIFISHHLDEIFDVCDRISVLRDGANAGVARVDECDIDTLVEMMVDANWSRTFRPSQRLR